MNEYERKRGHPCDSEEWFFKILGAPEYKHIWAPNSIEEKEEKDVNSVISG